jgi:hypothetical protein
MRFLLFRITGIQVGSQGSLISLKGDRERISSRHLDSFKQVVLQAASIGKLYK